MNSFSYTPSRGEFIHQDILWNTYTTIEILQKVSNFQFLPSDIVVNTFPRSGTTLTQEIVWQIKNKDTIKKGVKYGDIDERFPFLEFNSKFFDSNLPYPVDVLEEQKTKNQYRLIKTHCPLTYIQSNLIQSLPKCIVVFRNPRDVCVSLYHFYRGMVLFGPWPGTWDEFVEMFQRGFTKCGSWTKWHRDWWKEIGASQIEELPFQTVSKNSLPILFFTFEMLIKNPKTVIESIASFLGETLTNNQLDIILHNSNFKQMVADDNLNFQDNFTGFRFIRQGQIGNWKSYFTEEQIGKFKKLVEIEMENFGVKFEYD